jgi:hypothetical protein
MIPTAKDFLKNSHATGMAFNREAIQEVMIEFAKLHVKAALEAAVENVLIDDICLPGTPMCSDDFVVNKDSILKAYTEDLIK